MPRPTARCRDAVINDAVVILSAEIGEDLVPFRCGDQSAKDHSHKPWQRSWGPTRRRFASHDSTL